MKIELGEVQMKFAELIWENEPIGSGELVRLCSQNFGWKKSTTYTVLKKLCEKGLFQNNEGIVSSLISKDEFYSKKTEEFVENTFGGSLPAFFAAFTSKQKLSKEDIKAIKKMIDDVEK
ncbi:Predicted transcriptional regulator [Butyrivibrio sp. INlla18]|uniref:BlaI/MecI/CopY family transcriptional regulator n=1 Tax=Butyrivibrio sp. INlla18 TaxID=1520806 RepID=UPI000890DF46|nr:BlaI/MecI/CopY family transcriptional regulator [Butyrivibrio sp. INlla18]SDA47586.1 Predicted transcriptional regulator [Butyrivibrio sp. INlla18]